jgi:hypothetical protein
LKLSSIFEAQLVRMPLVQNRSLCASGAPSSAPALTSGTTGVSGLGLGDGQVFGDGNEAIELRVQLGDTRQQVAGQFFGRKLFIGESASDLCQSHLMHCRLIPLVDDFRNQIKAVFDRWCDGLIGIAMIGSR